MMQKKIKRITDRSDNSTHEPVCSGFHCCDEVNTTNCTASLSCSEYEGSNGGCAAGEAYGCGGHLGGNDGSKEIPKPIADAIKKQKDN